MHQHNDGYSDSDSLQRYFTAYLQVAVKRSKGRYLHEQYRIASMEPSCDFQDRLSGAEEEPDLLAGLPSMDVLENERLLRALRSLNARDLETLLDLIVYDMTPAELSRKLGLNYQGAMAVYYRAIKKVRKLLEGGEQS